MLLTSPKGNFDLYGDLNHLLTVNKMEIKNKKKHTYNFNKLKYNLTHFMKTLPLFTSSKINLRAVVKCTVSIAKTIRIKFKRSRIHPQP